MIKLVFGQLMLTACVVLAVSARGQTLGSPDVISGQFMTMVACTPETGAWEEIDTLLFEDNRSVELVFMPWARKPALSAQVTLLGNWIGRDRFEVNWVVSESIRMMGGNPTTGEQRFLCVAYQLPGRYDTERNRLRCKAKDVLAK
jgi:hypothetical protein